MKYWYACLLSIVALALSAQHKTITELNDTAETLLNSNPMKALEIARKASIEAEEAKAYAEYCRSLVLRGIANYKVDNYEKATDLFDNAIEASTKHADTTSLAYATYWLGNIYLHNSEYAKALDSYLQVAELAAKTNDLKNLARSQDGRASIYEALGELDKAEELYLHSLQSAQKAQYKEWYPTVKFSLANIAYTQGNIQQAIDVYNEAIKESEAVGNLNNKANSLQQLASIYYTQNKSQEAMKYIQQAMDIFQQTGSTSSFSFSRLLMAAILLKDRQYDDAISLAQKSFDEGKAKKENRLQRDAAEILYYAYLGKGNNTKALESHVLFHNLSESEYKNEVTKKVTQQELQSNFEREREIEGARQAKLNLEKDTKIAEQRMTQKLYIIGIGFILIIAGLSIFAFMQKRKDTRLIADEKTKSDKLLLSILPADVIADIKQSGTVHNTQPSSVLFADIKNFARGANADIAKLSQLKEQAIKKLDDIAMRYRLSRIKNISDACLYVAEPHPDGVAAVNNVMHAATEMMAYVEKLKETQLTNGEQYIDLSIGIHSGPMIAGIVGVRKTDHDVWGDTVNIAARMEQHSETGKINVSERAYEMVKDKYKGKHHGKITDRNNDEIEMFFLEA